MATDKRSKGQRTKRTVWTFAAITYCVLPFVITFSAFGLKDAITSELSGFEVNDAAVLNSDETMERTIAPFASTFLFAISLALSLLAAWLIERKAKASNRSCSDTEVIGKLVFVIEIVVVAFSFIAVVYAQALGFDYRSYEITLEDIESTYIPLQKIPSLESLGLTSPSAPWYYNMLISMSQFFRTIIDNIDWYLALVSALIIPAKVRLFLNEKR